MEKFYGKGRTLYVICMDSFFKFKRSFFWWMRHKIRREEDSSRRRAANCYKSTGRWVFWGGFWDCFLEGEKKRVRRKGRGTFLDFGGRTFQEFWKRTQLFEVNHYFLRGGSSRYLRVYVCLAEYIRICACSVLVFTLIF